MRLPSLNALRAFDAAARHGSFTLAAVDHTFVALQAAEDGLGVAVVPVLFAARCLAAGRLVAPFATAQAVSGTYFILHRAGALSPAVQAFHDWLRAQGAATCTMLPPPLMPVRDSGDH